MSAPKPPVGSSVDPEPGQSKSKSKEQMNGPDVPSGTPPPYASRPPQQDAAPPPMPSVDQQQPQQGQPLYRQAGQTMDAQPLMTGVTLQPAAFTMVNPIGVMFSSAPAIMQCPNCQQQVVTQVTFEPGSCAWLSVLGCLLFGCWMGCCLIPLCVNDFQDVIHSCPSCHHFIGTYRRL